MNKIEKKQMEEFLTNRDNRRYTDVLEILKRTHIRADFYKKDNDFIIEIIYPNNFTEYYIDLSYDENIKFLCELIKDKKILLKSFTENIYKSPVFIEYFGVIEPFEDKRYGLFKKIKHKIILPENDEIRQLTTINDFDTAEKFAELIKEKEEHWQPPFELAQYIESLKQGNKYHRIYGYFRNNIMTAFLNIGNSDAMAFIGYIYTVPEYRQNNMALNLIKHFINEFADKNMFICYGTAQNENSQKTALSAGFELFSTTYYH